MPERAPARHQLGELLDVEFRRFGTVGVALALVPEHAAQRVGREVVNVERAARVLEIRRAGQDAATRVPNRDRAEDGRVHRRDADDKVMPRHAAELRHRALGLPLRRRKRAQRAHRRRDGRRV